MAAIGRYAKYRPVYLCGYCTGNYLEQYKDTPDQLRTAKTNLIVLLLQRRDLFLQFVVGLQYKDTPDQLRTAKTNLDVEAAKRCVQTAK